MVELIFFHLPKTGGSSIHQWLIDHYGQDAVRHFERDECLELAAQGKSISSQLTPHTKAIHGHVRYVEVSDVVGAHHPKLATFFREPVARVVSNFRWWKHTLQTDPQHPSRHLINATLEQYVHFPQAQNKMSFFLEGLDLNQLDFVGFFERFDRDYARFQAWLGGESMVPYHAKQMAKSNLDLKEQTPHLKEVIKAANAQDMIWYQRAWEKWGPTVGGTPMHNP